VGAARGRGRRAPLVIVVTVHHSWSSSSSLGPKLRAADHLRLSMPPPTAFASPSPATPPPHHHQGEARRGEPTAFDVGGTWCASSL
jgi:hypothetical protein